MHSAGIVGLAPASAFYDFLFTNYKFKNDTVHMAVELRNNGNSSPGARLNSNTTDIFRGTTFAFTSDPKSLDMINGANLTFVKNPTTDYWSLPNVMVTAKINNKTTTLHQGTACVAYKSSSALITNQFTDYGEQLSMELCGKKHCPVGTDITNGPVINVTIADAAGKLSYFEIQPEDYFVDIGDNNTDLAVAVEDASETEQADCQPGLSFGFGRAFLMKNQLIMKRDMNGDSYIGFITGGTPASNSVDREKQAVVIVCVGFVLILMILAWILSMNLFGPSMIKGKKVEGDNYSAAKNSVENSE